MTSSSGAAPGAGAELRRSAHGVEDQPRRKIRNPYFGDQQRLSDGADERRRLGSRGADQPHDQPNNGSSDEVRRGTDRQRRRERSDKEEQQRIDGKKGCSRRTCKQIDTG